MVMAFLVGSNVKFLEFRGVDCRSAVIQWMLIGAGYGGGSGVRLPEGWKLAAM